MAEITCKAVARVGVDLSKRVFQVHAVDRSGRVLLAKAMSLERFFAWCAELPGGCLVAMEYWSPEGWLVHSDQLALLQAFSNQGRDRGYLVLVELDAGPGPVSLAEVIGAVQQAETALAR